MLYPKNEHQFVVWSYQDIHITEPAKLEIIQVATAIRNAAKNYSI